MTLQVDAYRKRIAELEAQLASLQAAIAKEGDDIEQTLGKALGYPRYVDDPVAFPDATEDDGVCVGEHVPASIAAEAAARIDALEDEVARLDAETTRYCSEAVAARRKALEEAKTAVRGLFFAGALHEERTIEAAIDAIRSLVEKEPHDG